MLIDTWKNSQEIYPTARHLDSGAVPVGQLNAVFYDFMLQGFRISLRDRFKLVGATSNR